MTDNTAELAASLRPIAQKIEGWRAEAQRIHGLADEALGSKRVEAELLQSIEETAGAIYEEIARFETIVAEVAKTSPAAAAELAEVGDALQLVLMEITELGTAMYSVRSQAPEADAG